MVVQYGHKRCRVIIHRHSNFPTNGFAKCKPHNVPLDRNTGIAVVWPIQCDQTRIICFGRASIQYKSTVLIHSGSMVWNTESHYNGSGRGYAVFRPSLQYFILLNFPIVDRLARICYESICCLQCSTLQNIVNVHCIVPNCMCNIVGCACLLYFPVS